MAKQTVKKSSRKRRLFVVSALIIALLCALAFALERTNIINLFGKSTPTPSPSSDDAKTTDPQTTIDYSPGTEQDNAEINAKKQNGTIDANPPTPSNTTPIDVSLSAAGQDTANGPVVVRAILSNLSGGTCKLSMTKDQTVRTYSAAVEWSGTYYSCSGFSVPIADLSSGTWNASLTVQQGGNSGSASQTINVTKGD